MKAILRPALFAAAALSIGVAVPGAAFAGCASGAVVGGVAGHVAGHHAVLGAAAGCVIGHHRAVEKRRAEQAQAAHDAQMQAQPAPPPPGQPH